MAPGGSKFEGPTLEKAGPVAHTGQFLKLAERVEQTLAQEAINQQPKQLDPDRVFVGPNNRLGASPNVQHVHFGILKSIRDKGFDSSRPAIGICVEYKSEAGRKMCIEHNKRFTTASGLLPPIVDLPGPVYGTIACSHLNLALRLIKHSCRSPVGALEALLEQPSLKDVVQDGHRWWILPETTGKEKQTDISL